MPENVTSLPDVRLSVRGLALARPMDQRIVSFLTDVLALAGEEPDVVRDEVRVALGDYAAIFWAQEPNKLMKDKAAHACRVLMPRSRRRGARAPPGDTNRRALEAGAQHYRPAAALSRKSPALAKSGKEKRGARGALQ
jgi:hypothetical protein